MKENISFKILIVGHCAGLGGGDRYIFDQAKLLLNRGHTVNCITFEGGALEKAYCQQGILFSVQPISQLSCQKIKDVVLDYDIVIANTMYTVFFAYEAQRYRPAILILHDCPSYMENLFARTSLARQELEQIRHLFGVSRYHVEAMKELGFKHVGLLNNFVPDACPAVLHRANDSKIKFLTVANWSPVKGYDLALDAFQCLTDEEKEQIEWHIVGKMENEQMCKRFQKRAETERWIHFHGAINDKGCLYNLYRKSSVYLQMSREDSCPLAVIDAAMLQMPMIASQDTGSNYLAENGAGWVVDEHASEIVADAIRDAINNRDKLQEMGRRARENYLTNATPDIYIRELDKMVEGIVDKDGLLFRDSMRQSANNTESKKGGSAVPEESRRTGLGEKKNKPRIILYGYNMYAQIECFYHRKDPAYELVGIYDMAYEKYREQGIEIKNPNELATEDFDFVCICCVYKSTIETIKKFLVGLGIPKEKICIGVNQIFEAYGRKNE